MTSSSTADKMNPTMGDSKSAYPISVALLQSTPEVPGRPRNRALAMPTPMIEPIMVWELEAGKPSHQVPRFQTIAAISSANTIAKPALLPTCRISSTGSRDMIPNATAPKRPKAACAAPAHWCANTCSAQRTADERAHELLSWSRRVRERLPGRTPDARCSCGGATRLGHRRPDRTPLAILGRGRCRPRRATRMPDVLDCGPGRDAFARPSRFNDQIVVDVREPAPRCRGWRATADEDGHYCFAVAL